jgi:hypothetical protein
LEHSPCSKGAIRDSWSSKYLRQFPCSVS